MSGIENPKPAWETENQRNISPEIAVEL